MPEPLAGLGSAVEQRPTPARIKEDIRVIPGLRTADNGFIGLKRSEHFYSKSVDISSYLHQLSLF